MTRTLLALVALAVGSTAVLVYLETVRDREYTRLIAEGEAALASEESVLAIEAFSGAIALRPDAMLAYLRRGSAYRQRGELDAARRDLRTAVQLDPTATRPLEELGDVNYALGRYARAGEEYARHLALDDRSARVLYKLGLSRYREGNVVAAIPPLRQAVELDDRFAEASYLLGVCLRETDPDAARAALERASELSPALIHAREALVGLHRTAGRTADEIVQLEAIAALEPARADRQIALALAHARAGHTNLAVLTLGRTAERYPDDPQVYAALGRVWLESAGDRLDRVALGKALEALQDPVGAGTAATSETLTLLGRALLLADDAELAEQVLQRAASRFPIDPQAFEYLARTADRLGHPLAARDALLGQEALAGEGEAPARRIARAARIGELSLDIGEPSVAVHWLRRAARTNASPTAELLGRLAEAEWQAGEVEAARSSLERALAADPSNFTLRRLDAQLRGSAP